MRTKEQNRLTNDIRTIGTLFGKTENCEFYTTISKEKKGNTIHYWFLCNNHYEFVYELSGKNEIPNIRAKIEDHSPASFNRSLIYSTPS